MTIKAFTSLIFHQFFRDFKSTKLNINYVRADNFTIVESDILFYSFPCNRRTLVTYDIVFIPTITKSHLGVTTLVNIDHLPGQVGIITSSSNLYCICITLDIFSLC
jgi:hypothetical protein